MIKKIENYFSFSERNAFWKKEIYGGIVTFLAMAYILAVQPGMLSHIPGKEGVMPEGGLFLATAISAFLATFLMGIFARVPFALAPGMGVNAFFTFTVASKFGLNLSPGEALSATLVSGLIYAIIVLSPLRRIVIKAIPRNLKLAIGSAIGFFIAMIGLNDSGIVRSDAQILNGKVSSPVLMKFGDLSHPLILVAIGGLLLLLVLHVLKVKGAIIITIIISSIIVIILQATKIHDTGQLSLNKYKDLKTIKDIAGKGFTSMGKMFANPKSYIAIFVFLYIDFFDTTSTLMSIGKKANLTNEDGDAKWYREANMVDAIGTVVGASIGVSTISTFTESAIGTEAGARTGIAPIITSILFILSIAAWPILKIMMPINVASTNVNHASLMPITGPILIFVGGLMIAQLRHISWNVIDTFTTFIIIIFTIIGFSISTGAAAGFLVWSIMHLALFFKAKLYHWDYYKINSTIPSDETLEKDYYDIKINWLMLVLGFISFIYFATMPLYM